MLNLPLISSQPSLMEPAAPKKPTDSRQEKSNFSDTYDAIESGNDRPSDDVSDTRDATADTSDQDRTAPDSPSDRDGSRSDSDREPESREDADFVATEVAQTPDETTSPLGRPNEGRVAPGDDTTLPNTARVDVDTPKKAAPTGPGPDIQDDTVKGIKPQGPDIQDVIDPPDTPHPGDVETLAVETPEDLDPMRVEVRSLNGREGQTRSPVAQSVLAAQAQTAQSQATAAQGSVAPATTEEGSAGRAVDQVEETTAPKAEAPSTPTISTTQQMQARAIMEQVQAGGQSVLSKGADVQATQGMDVSVAAVEDTHTNTRGLLSAQEAASQARLNNSAPNPAYVVRQLADAVKMSDKNLIELAMDPPELGKVRMSMSETSGVMTVTIAAENQATTELMRRHIDMLRKDFMELGYESVSFSFEQNGSDSSQDQAQSGDGFGSGNGSGQDRGDGTLLGELASVTTQNGRTQSLPDTGLDIRL
ncbi:hypothetical protein NBRC116594_20250 [Shimia sp. NS0008-38b]|uniref:flagellar hook-length control protein FliK n=1 Tax=Shimia sp. NS0008-38b TaxID=3127653 RepID=UPI003109679E